MNKEQRMRWQLWHERHKWTGPFNTLQSCGSSGSAGWERRKQPALRKSANTVTHCWQKAGALECACPCRLAPGEVLNHTQNDQWHWGHRMATEPGTKPGSLHGESLKPQPFQPGKHTQVDSWRSCSAGAYRWLCSGHRPCQSTRPSQLQQRSVQQRPEACSHWRIWCSFQRPSQRSTWVLWRKSRSRLSWTNRTENSTWENRGLDWWRWWLRWAGYLQCDQVDD